MRVQQQQTGDDGHYRVTEQVNGMPHFFTVAFDHGLQFFDAFGCCFAPVIRIQAVGNREHTDNEVKTHIHNAAMIPQPLAER